jgi:hypothetical protein
MDVWRERFMPRGIDAMRKGAPRSGRPAGTMAEMEPHMAPATLHEKPGNATHWSPRTLAKHLGVGSTKDRTAWLSTGMQL